MSALGLTVALLAAAVAFLMWKQGWGQGRWNTGPRSGAIAIMAASTAVAALLSAWTGQLLAWLAGIAQAATGQIGQPEVSELLSTVITQGPWIGGVVLLLLWLAALGPAKVAKTRMQWPLAWAGAAIPPLVLLGPPGVQAVAGSVASATVAAVSYIGSAFLGGVA